MQFATPDDALAALRARGYVVFDRGPGSAPYNLQIIGVRSSAAATNAFDDRCHVVYRDERGDLKMDSWPITTDPGTYWLQNPGRVAGTAVLKPGQYRAAWELGPHKGKQALVQIGPVTVYRDPNRDATLDKGQEDTGLFGINLHRAGLNSRLVDKWSAGCQVWANDADFEALLKLCRKQAARGKGWQSFSYTLLEAA